MTALLHLPASPLVHALGWTLLHFCWQGALVAVVLACALRLLPSQSSRLRYSIACAAMACMVLLPSITFCLLAANTQSGSQQADHAVAYVHLGTAFNLNFDDSFTRRTVQFESILNQLLPAVIVSWFSGVLILLLRLNLGLMATRKMKSSAVESVAPEMRRVLQTLRTRLRIQRAIELLNSAHVQAPTVIGWLKPAILLPIGCMASLSSTQIEAILAHELAHIRRHDYLVSLFQSVTEAVLFYHPAVWWVSNQIRREREHCCDDLAVAVCGDRLAYARALSSLEERRSPLPASAFSVTGGVLKMRIARLLGLNQPTIFSRTAAATLLVLAAATAGLTVWGSARAQSIPPQTGAAPNQAASVQSPDNSTIHVRSLTIDSTDLPDSDRAPIVQAYQGSSYPLEELIERIRQNMRDQGYAKATVVLLQPASTPAAQPSGSIDVTVRVSAGARYTLSGFSITGAQAFSQDEILQQFPLHPGDRFNATAIGSGLVRLKTLYVSKGYRNFGFIPSLQTDEVRHTVTLVIEIKEGKTTTT